MPIAYSSLSSGKTPRVLTLTSGTSWTVPAGVTYVNVTLMGGGGAGGATDSASTVIGQNGFPGAVVSSTVATTPGATISYTIGAGGTGVAFSTNNGVGGAGGTTTFTGATSATGGNPGVSGGLTNINGFAGLQLSRQNNGGGASVGSARTGGNGGAGAIYIEYWV